MKGRRKEWRRWSLTLNSQVFLGLSGLLWGYNTLDERPHTVWEAHVKKQKRQNIDLTWQDFEA